jgi:hypothetical protein
MYQSVKSNVLLRSVFCILTSAFLLPLASCDQIGGIGGVLAQAVPRHVDAAYKGLANQTVIVMVWMDRGMRADHPDLQMDIAAGLQGKLIDIARTDKPDLLKGTEFPVMASTVIHYQEDHPEIEFEPITTTAAKLDGTRLIFLEIKEFSTHAGAPELFHGALKGDLKVVEMTVTGKDKAGKDIVNAKVAYHEEDIQVVDNKQDPKDGTPIGTESTVTQKTIAAFTTDVAKRFYPHDEDRD